MIRRTPLKRVPMKRRALKKWKLELDQLCRTVTFARDGHACCRCGVRDPLHWCHVNTRAVLSLRWNLDNVLALCAGCHLWNHHHPTAFSEWWTEKYPERAQRLALWRPGGRVEPELIRLWLLQQGAS